MANAPLPNGARNHGDPNLLCLPPKWTDYFTFFATNYFLHAATVVTQPGQPFLEKAIDTASALFVPASGALRAVRVIMVASTIDRRNSLRTAARAGALCMVVSRDSLHLAREEDPNIWFRIPYDPAFVSTNTTIFGACILPQNDTYRLIQVPPEVPLTSLDSGSYRTSAEGSDYTHSMEESFRRHSSIVKVPSSTDIPKVFISIVQTVWGAFTLFGSRGNQIQLYGYGAFGLTVFPYVLMSVLNLITNVLRPEYPSMYLVETEDMDQARKEGGRFSGMVASVDSSRIDIERPIRLEPRLLQESWMIPTYLVLALIIAIVIPLGVVGGATGFREGSDLTVQRSWILAWLIIGSVSSIWVLWVENVFLRAVIPTSRHESNRNLSPVFRTWLALFVSLPLWIPAIGGMVVVGKMLRDFGICTNID